MQLDFYTRFKAQNPQVEIGFIAFHKFKPFSIYKLKDFNSCCCRYHQEIMDIKVGFNNMKASFLHHGGDEFFTYGCEAICANPKHRATVGPTMSC
jgi:hypothetical protein